MSIVKKRYLLLAGGLLMGLTACTGSHITSEPQQLASSASAVQTATSTPAPESKKTALPTLTPTAGVPTSTSTPKSSLEEVLLANARHIRGPVEAPVTLIEFSDFKCGYCGRFATSTLSQLQEEYIETGKVRFIFRNAAFLGPESTKAAEGSECAAEQGAFWDFHDLLFSDQIENHSRVSDDYLMGLAENIGVDAVAFKECLDTARHDDKAIELAIRLKSRGARGVPGFLINGQYIAGALPYESFQQYIEQELAQSAK